jgi:hypothetical protein
MRSLLARVSLWFVACGSPAAPVPPAAPQHPPATSAAPSGPSSSLPPGEPWAIPPGFRHETIPFPLEFAPGIPHQGVEELRFAPGFFDPAAPGYWAYAFVWRTSDPAALDASGLAAELTQYFRGLIAAVDAALPGNDTITVGATTVGARMAITAHVIDAFKTKRPLDLVGWADRQICGAGALWRFVLAPADSALRSQLDSLAMAAVCDQPVPPPRR